MGEALRDISSLIDLDKLMLFARTLVTPIIGVTNALATSVQGLGSAVESLDSRVDLLESKSLNFSVDLTTGHLMWEETTDE